MTNNYPPTSVDLLTLTERARAERSEYIARLIKASFAAMRSKLHRIMVHEPAGARA